eukprot:6628892-Prymnesium_polylepis.1
MNAPPRLTTQPLPPHYRTTRLDPTVGTPRSPTPPYIHLHRPLARVRFPHRPPRVTLLPPTHTHPSPS